MNDEWPENAWLLLHEAKSRWGRQTSPRQVEYTRADLAAERERKLMEALKLTVEDLEEWSGCKSALEAAGFNMADTQVRAEFARATLKELGYE